MIKSLSSWPCWDPLAAILGLTGSAVLQAVSECPCYCQAGISSCSLFAFMYLGQRLWDIFKSFIIIYNVLEVCNPTNLIPQAQYQIHLPFLNFLLMQPQLTLEEFINPSFLFKFWLMNCSVSLKVSLKSVSSIKKWVKSGFLEEWSLITPGILPVVESGRRLISEN